MTQDNLIQTDSPLNASQQAVLDALLNLIIPPSEDGTLPGAADIHLVPFFVDAEPAYIDELSQELEGVIAALPPTFTTMSFDEQEALVLALREGRSAFFNKLTIRVFGCYYQQDQVLTALGQHAGPPFPEGNQVDPGDHGLLDPVRARGAVWREVSDR